MTGADDLRTRIAKLKDGRWHAVRPQQYTAKIECWPNNEALDRQPYSYRRQAYRAVVQRFLNGERQLKTCPHAHYKQGAADKCAERGARRLNREEES
jgi:hypothetical protein